MTAEKALQIKDFCNRWITKVVSNRKAYQARLKSAVDDLFPDNIEKYDPYNMLGVATWDEGEEYMDAYSGRKKHHCGMRDRLTNLNEWENIWGLTKKGKNDLSCTIRVAIDILVYQSGGVIGYTVGDLRKVYDGKIPDDILKSFKPKITSKTKDEEPIWL